MNKGINVIEQTFAMIKPDAVKEKNTGRILTLIEDSGFDILRMHKVMLTKEGAERFYAVHKDKPFFNELIEFVTSGPVLIMVLEKDNAITEWRKLMGATDPAKADEGTIRSLYAESIGKNAVHGSDSKETAQEELSLFFAPPAPPQQQPQAK